MRRPDDWFRQAELDLEAAVDARASGHFEWACFLAQQSGEKVVKSVHEMSGAEAWGHSVAGLLEELDEVPAEIMDAGRGLDKHYIPTRYPNAHPEGAPGDVYTDREAELAIADARRVFDYAAGLRS
jgi:HEPN domain-containing protein